MATLIETTRNTRGSSLAIAIVMMTLLATVGAAIVEVSRFGQLAARAQVSAAVAMHLADVGLEAYERGASPAVGTLRVESSSGEASISGRQLLVMADSTVLVLVESRGMAPVHSRATGRRSLIILMMIETSGVRRRLHGTLMEDF